MTSEIFNLYSVNLSGMFSNALKHRSNCFYKNYIDKHLSILLHSKRIQRRTNVRLENNKSSFLFFNFFIRVIFKQRKHRESSFGISV